MDELRRRAEQGEGAPGGGCGGARLSWGHRKLSLASHASLLRARVAAGSCLPVTYLPWACKPSRPGELSGLV